MRSGAITLLFLMLAFVFQTTIGAHFFSMLAQATGITDFAAQQFDLVFLALIYLALHRGRSSAIIWVVLGSIMASAFGLAWQGATSISWVAIVVLLSFMRGRIMLRGAGAIMILVSAMTLLEALLHLSIGKMIHGNSLISWGQSGHVFRHIVLQTLIGPLVFFILRSLDHWTGVMQERRAFPLTGY